MNFNNYVQQKKAQCIRLYISVCVSGMISLRNWASATERVLNLGLPWRVLRPQLVSSTQYGMVDYQLWIRELSINEPKLEVSLVQLVSNVHFLTRFSLSLTHTQSRKILIKLSLHFRSQITASWRRCTKTIPTWKPSSEL